VKWSLNKIAKVGKTMWIIRPLEFYEFINPINIMTIPTKIATMTISNKNVFQFIGGRKPSLL